MLQDIQVTQISELSNTSVISSESLFVVSNPEQPDYSSYSVTYKSLSSQVYRDILNRTGPDDGDVDPLIATLSAKIDELTTAVLRLANCAKQVRTVDLRSINRRLENLEEYHATPQD